METTATKYETLPGWFASFCDPIESVRYPGLVRPWTDPADGFIYATDGRAIVRVHSGLIAEDARPEVIGPRDQRTRRVPSNPGRDLYGTRPGDEWEESPLEPPGDVPPWKKTCPTCEGRPMEPHREPCEECGGRGYDAFLVDGVYLRPTDVDACEACDGAGSIIVDWCDRCDNRGFVVAWDAVAIPGRVDGLTLSVANVRRVLDCGGLIYARKGPDAPRSALKFTVGEDFEGRLMPVRNSTTTTEA
jgi:hypothetical protein